MELTQMMTAIRTLNSTGLDQIEALIAARRNHLGGNSKEAAADGGEAQKPKEATGPKRAPIWEREVLRHFPTIQAFGKQNSVDRGKNAMANQLASILAGVTKRGKDLGLTEEGIVAQSLPFEMKPELLKKLFLTKEGSDESFQTLQQTANEFIQPLPAEEKLRLLNGLKRSREVMEGDNSPYLPVRAAVPRWDDIDTNDVSALTNLSAPFGTAPEGDVRM